MAPGLGADRQYRGDMRLNCSHPLGELFALVGAVVDDGLAHLGIGGTKQVEFKQVIRIQLLKPPDEFQALVPADVAWQQDPSRKLVTCPTAVGTLPVRLKIASLRPDVDIFFARRQPRKDLHQPAPPYGRASPQTRATGTRKSDGQGK